MIRPFLLLALFAGCAPVPDLPPRAAAAPGWPVLGPVGPLPAATSPAEAAGAGLLARAAALRARAAALGGPVLSPEERAELDPAR